MEKLSVKIEGMTCKHCVMAVKKGLENIGIESAEVEIGKAEISFNPDKTSISDIEDTIAEEGYKVVN